MLSLRGVANSSHPSQKNLRGSILLKTNRRNRFVALGLPWVFEQEFNRHENDLHGKT
jgi:hypothetical protein